MSITTAKNEICDYCLEKKDKGLFSITTLKHPDITILICPGCIALATVTHNQEHMTPERFDEYYQEILNPK